MKSLIQNETSSEWWKKKAGLVFHLFKLVAGKNEERDHIELILGQNNFNPNVPFQVEGDNNMSIQLCSSKSGQLFNVTRVTR